MRYRAVLIALFLIPLLWGAVSLLRAASAHGTPDCPGLQLGPDGEDHPGPMRPGDTCALSYDTATGHSIGTGTYQQAVFAQDLKRRSLYRQGTLFIFYGAAGTGIVLIAARRREAAAPHASDRWFGAR
ncbi:hypothetical protein ABZT03_06455 [Streptomyces sp. NPDC005574]|uniref:hypothetical protein n=1 Tax=Streptomyces sp. NPDC005574 TaxID=3156891 RepID=UPI0033BF77DA